MTDYSKRLRIPVERGDSRAFYTCPTGEKIAVGYVRIVLGGRGPYIEFTKDQLCCDQMVAQSASHYYYTEYRTKADNVKIYHQRHLVDYADYRIGFYYIDPFKLRTDEGSIIEPLRKRPTTGYLF